MQPKTVRQRVENYRSRLRRAGLRPVQLWLPDTRSVDFAAECRRQSLLIVHDPVEAAELDLIVALADWGSE